MTRTRMSISRYGLDYCTGVLEGVGGTTIFCEFRQLIGVSTSTLRRGEKEGRSICGHIQSLKLHQRVFNCSKCGHSQDRDENASINLEKAPSDRVRLA